MNNALIFISYSHHDEKWRDLLVKHLRVLQRDDSFSVWTDEEIGMGEDWETKIREALENACVAILLVSADSLTSNFILREEVARLLEKRANEGLRFIPIIIRHCGWQGIDWLKQLNVRPKGGGPLLNKSRAEKEFAAIALDLIDLFKTSSSGAESLAVISGSKRQDRAPNPEAESSPSTTEAENQRKVQALKTERERIDREITELTRPSTLQGQPTSGLASGYQERSIEPSGGVSPKSTQDNPEF
jgi:hypothetical protein